MIGGEVDFHCCVCGKETPIAPKLPERAVCEDHCPDHDYEYDKSAQGHFCKLCDKRRPEDYYDDWES